GKRNACNRSQLITLPLTCRYVTSIHAREHPVGDAYQSRYRRADTGTQARPDDSRISPETQVTSLLNGSKIPLDRRRRWSPTRWVSLPTGVLSMVSGNGVPTASDREDSQQLRDIQDLIARLELVNRQLSVPLRPMPVPSQGEEDTVPDNGPPAGRRPGPHPVPPGRYPRPGPPGPPGLRGLPGSQSLVISRSSRADAAGVRAAARSWAK